MGKSYEEWVGSRYWVAVETWVAAARAGDGKRGAGAAGRL